MTPEQAERVRKAEEEENARHPGPDTSWLRNDINLAFPVVGATDQAMQLAKKYGPNVLKTLGEAGRAANLLPGAAPPAAAGGPPMPQGEADESAGLSMAGRPAPAAVPPKVRKATGRKAPSIEVGDSKAGAPDVPVPGGPASLMPSAPVPTPAPAAGAQAAPAAPTKDDELEAAQARASAAHNSLGSILARIFGSDEVKRQTLEREQMPVTQLLQRRQAMAAQEERAGKAAEVERVKRLSDPASHESRVAQAVAVKNYGVPPEEAKGLTAADLPLIHQGFSASEAIKAREAATQERLQAAQIAAEARKDVAHENNATRQMIGALAHGNAKDIPPAVSTQVGASANSGRMIDKLSEMHDQASRSGNPADWKRYNDMVETLAPSIAAGVNRTGVARGELVKEIKNNLHTGLLTGASDTLFHTGFVKNKLAGYKEEAASRGRESIDSIGDRYDKSALERQHSAAFGGGAAAGGPPVRAGWEHMPDGSKFPVDAQGNRIGPAVR